MAEMVMDFDTFCELVAKMEDSSPGPDGIPYSAWKSAGKKGLRETPAAHFLTLSARVDVARRIARLESRIAPPRANAEQIAPVARENQSA